MGSVSHDNVCVGTGTREKSNVKRETGETVNGKEQGETGNGKRGNGKRETGHRIQKPTFCNTGNGMEGTVSCLGAGLGRVNGNVAGQRESRYCTETTGILIESSQGAKVTSSFHMAFSLDKLHL